MVQTCIKAIVTRTRDPNIYARALEHTLKKVPTRTPKATWRINTLRSELTESFLSECLFLTMFVTLEACRFLLKTPGAGGRRHVCIYAFKCER